MVPLDLLWTHVKYGFRWGIDCIKNKKNKRQKNTHTHIFQIIIIGAVDKRCICWGTSSFSPQLVGCNFIIIGHVDMCLPQHKLPPKCLKNKDVAMFVIGNKITNHYQTILLLSQKDKAVQDQPSNVYKSLLDHVTMILIHNSVMRLTIFCGITPHSVWMMELDYVMSDLK